MRNSGELKAEDKVTFKKPHPCGSNRWLLLKVGNRMEIKCIKCGKKIILSREEFEKRYKSKPE